MREMKYSPGFLGEGTVGRVLDERMLKVVGRKGISPSWNTSPDATNRVEGILQLAVRHFESGL